MPSARVDKRDNSPDTSSQSNSEPSPPAPPTTWRVSHILIVAFLIPIVILQCWKQGQHLYHYLDIPTLWLRVNGIVPEEKAQIDELASLLDQIYSTLANMTYLPSSSIKRGPHSIKTTNAAYNSQISQLLSALPYIDQPLPDKEPWLFETDFVDYTDPKEREDTRDPLLCEGQYMTPSMIALNSIGVGWSVLIYDFEGNKIRMINALEWSNSALDWQPLLDFDRVEARKRRDMICHGDDIRQFWEDLPYIEAPFFLRDLLQRYRDGDMIPWTTTPEMDAKAYKNLLLQHGWPDTFNADRFRANLFRLQNRASPHGNAKAAHSLAAELEGKPPFTSPGLIANLKQHLLDTFTQLSTTPESDSETKLQLSFQHERLSLDLARRYDELHAAKTLIARLCPAGVCVKPEDVASRNCLNVKKEHAELVARFQRGYPEETECHWRETATKRSRRTFLGWRRKQFWWAGLAVRECEKDVRAEGNGVDLDERQRMEEERMSLRDCESGLAGCPPKKLPLLLSTAGSKRRSLGWSRR
ncbi:hypothetical protein BU24DRAFT_404362 [Aaosphaeria arxii CBS 175.79]|uniref:Uncharacterized protein n=1 Tax=Aaosphaeria arxii CBS 175.79 TaxID=1450172 RepID=A0A6A5Y8K8_9PLEO|nr:uncharacterized protein BU24DRAFT_404362 [Aaosphaeria arxii CBS 175.79]KAF2021347.1 hypothetical protein BU24DRAFT_404362 [Aaosphaeria arxii CBS 175.79]